MSLGRDWVRSDREGKWPSELKVDRLYTQKTHQQHHLGSALLETIGKA